MMAGLIVALLAISIVGLSGVTMILKRIWEKEFVEKEVFTISIN